MELASKFFDVLLSSPLQATVSLVIFLLALPLILKGIKDRKEAASDSNSPWLVLEINEMRRTMDEHTRLLNEVLRRLN